MPSPWGSTQQRAAQRRNKHAALLATAARLFKQQGFAATSLDQMAAQLGITKPTLYYYVRSKSELVHACALTGWRQALASVQRMLQSTAPDRLAKALNAYASAVASDFGWCMVRVSEYAQPAALHKEIGLQRQALEQCLATVPTALPAPVLLRALEGVVLGLPKAQWRRAIEVLAAPVLQQDVAPALAKAQALPVRVEPMPLPQMLPEPPAPAMLPEPASPNSHAVEPPSLPLEPPPPISVQPPAKTPKPRVKPSKAVEQISLF